jgi:hypothetical protein
MRNPVIPKNKNTAPAAARNNSSHGRIQKNVLGADGLVSSDIYRPRVSRFQDGAVGRPIRVSKDYNLETLKA